MPRNQLSRIRDDAHGRKVSSRDHSIVDYVQFIFNGCIAIGILYVILNFVYIVHGDVQWKRYQKKLEDAFFIEQCKKDYEMNNCHPKSRLPALHAQCEEWYQCMNLDSRPSSHEYGVLWASTLAGILNEFTEQISIRTVSILLISTLCTIIATNVAFGAYRVYYVQNAP
ncbi:Brr6p Ecym_2601 [Eremothecium cymbalariae DBVPG|uniref:Brl1/Brr6 domain-containing protein n=1 Tax=Eremothecium cymbalariae (strain CBS 270.75 / DBVPG 7215 / KCTC 17166 / NRRL Y-17582) TaxID=931890 RepID=G8JQI1_ERECY|nr:Hypothetical protein Ecym_2601 [Eremothecium cymbalariae DBVPG\